MAKNSGLRGILHCLSGAGQSGSKGGLLEETICGTQFGGQIPFLNLSSFLKGIFRSLHDESTRIGRSVPPEETPGSTGFNEVLK